MTEFFDIYLFMNITTIKKRNRLPHLLRFDGNFFLISIRLVIPKLWYLTTSANILICNEIVKNKPLILYDFCNYIFAHKMIDMQISQSQFIELQKDLKDIKQILSTLPTPPPIGVREFKQRTNNQLSETIFYKLWNDEIVNRHYLEGTNRRFLERKSFEQWLKGKNLFHNPKPANNSTSELEAGK